MPLTAAPQHSVSIAGAVLQNGRVLAIQRRDNGRWEPPGGVLELDERIEDGLRREILEETGLVIEPVRLTGVYKNMRLGIVALVFQCTVTEGALDLSDETRAFAWLTPSQVRERMDEAYAVRLLDALDGGAVRVRSHDGAVLDRDTE